MASATVLFALSRQGSSAPTEVESALATALFNEGRALMRESRWSEACVKFSESQRLDPGGGTLLNLALCHEMEGKLATAWTEFTEALAIAERQRREDRTVFARSHLEKLEPQLPHVIVIVKDPAPEQELRLDRAVLRQPAWGTRVPLDPGAHVLSASAGGRRTYSVRFTLRAEQTLSVAIPRLELEPILAPDRAAGPERPRQQTTNPAGVRGGPSSLRAWAFLSLGIGAAGLSTGAIAGIAALQKQSRLDDACSEPAYCPREQQGNIDAMNRYTEISTVAFAIGAGAATAGGLMLMIGSDEPSQPAKDKALGNALSVRASLGARGAAISARF
jgi:hypothetical protein